MNNQYKTYYVTTDSENFVTGITTKDTDGAFPINILSNDIAEFTDPARMGLYKATKDGLYQVPGGKILDQAKQIENLKSIADQQAQKVNTLISQNQSLQKLLINLQASFTAQLVKLQTK